MKKILFSVTATSAVLSMLLLPSKAEAKGFGLETSYGQCVETAPVYFERPTYEDVYVFWIRVQHEHSGWEQC